MTMQRFKVYLAGPIGTVSWTQANEWRAKASERLLEMGHLPFSPLRGNHVFLSHAQPCEIEHLAKDYGITPRQIVTRDLWDIRRSDMVLANLENIRADNVQPIGTAMEIFYAAHVLNLPVITIANDCYSPWLIHHSIRVVASLDEALHLIEIYAGEEHQCTFT